MNIPEEKKKEINSPEELAEPEGKEGELKDESAKAATGGFGLFGLRDPDEVSEMLQQTTLV